MNVNIRDKDHILKVFMLGNFIMSFFGIFTVTSIGSITKFYSILLLILWVVMRNGKICIRYGSVVPLACLLLLLSAISILYSVNQARGVSYLMGMALNVAILIIITDIKWDTNDLSNVENVLFLAGTLLCFIALFSYHTSQYSIRREAYIFGVAIDANKEASLLIPVSVITLSKFLKKNNSFFLNIFYFLSLLLIAYTILSTGSRGGFLGQCFGIGVVVISSVRNKQSSKVKLWIVLLFLVFFLSSNFITSFIDSRLLDRIFSGYLKDNGAGRLILWQNALDAFKVHPILGRGLGSMIDLIGMEVHNSYLHMLCEVGIFGFLTYVLMIITCLIESKNNIKSLASMMGMMASIFFLSGFSASFFWVPIFYASISANIINVNNERKPGYTEYEEIM